MSMIEETARVVAVEDGGVWIEARRRSACGRCAARSGCGHGLLDDFVRDRPVHLRIDAGHAPADVEVGDFVRVGIEERALLRAALRVYALPLGGFLAGATAAALAGGGDALAAGAAFAGLAIGLLAARASQHAEGLESPRILGRMAPGTPRDDLARPVTVV
ncbi:MAG: SoxR reducing system RseC family protein [Pseudomonadales bacterium]|jgi:sigma-E factor negative regulatory protein RseC|nr:SoxR reducing system RseC family protein [Pseudomonadales bacterium]